MSMTADPVDWTVSARRELHDVVGPVLAAATMRAETARSRVDDQSDVADVIGQLLGDLHLALDEVRRLARTEPIRISSTVCLTEALVEEGRRFQEASDGRLRVDVRGLSSWRPIPGEVGYALRLMAAECLTNVARHADATRAWIRLRELPGGRLRLAVVDDGIGIAPTATSGTGVTSMSRRIEQCGGTLSLHGRDPNGTRVVAVLPAS